MNARSVKRTIGLAAAGVGTTGVIMLAPTAANAATMHHAHAQTVSNVSKASDGGYGYAGGYSSYSPYGERPYANQEREYEPFEYKSYQ